MNTNPKTFTVKEIRLVKPMGVLGKLKAVPKKIFNFNGVKIMAHNFDIAYKTFLTL